MTLVRALQDIRFSGNARPVWILHNACCEDHNGGLHCMQYIELLHNPYPFRHDACQAIGEVENTLGPAGSAEGTSELVKSRVTSRTTRLSCNTKPLGSPKRAVARLLVLYREVSYEDSYKLRAVKAVWHGAGTTTW